MRSPAGARADKKFPGHAILLLWEPAPSGDLRVEERGSADRSPERDGSERRRQAEHASRPLRTVDAVTLRRDECGEPLRRHRPGRSIRGWCSSGSRPSPRSSRRRGSPSTRRGRVLVIESHTHFPPKDYKGPPADRIRVFEDRDRDGRPEPRRHLLRGDEVDDEPGASPATARSSSRPGRAIYRLEDRDGDGRADGTDGRQGPRRRSSGSTRPGDYPHNGLSGFAFDATGRRLLRPGREPRRRLPADRPRRRSRSPAAARGATSTDAGPTARSSSGSPPASGTRST